MVAPTSITIIRHGEKPEGAGEVGVDAVGVQTPDGLTAQGWERARRLADLFSASEPRAPFVRPTRIIAPDYSGHEMGHRPFLTAMPTAQAVGTPIDVPYAEGEEDKLAKHLAEEMDGDILVCWEHNHIPAMAQAVASRLGVAPPLPPNATAWPADDFWTALVFTATPAGFTLTQASEGVLPGDPVA